MKENLLKKRKKKGFTLIELIVVIAIIAIIAMIAIPKVMGYQDSAKKKADVANAKSIVNTVAVEITNGHISTATATTIDVKSNTANPGTTPATSEDDINSYITKNMQSIPKQQYQNAGTDFYVSIETDGSVRVLTAKTGGKELYPNTDSGYTN